MKGYALAIGVIALTVPDIGYAADISRAHITCGGTVFRATTEQINYAPIFQQITADTVRGKRLIPLRERKVAYPHELGRMPGLGFIVGTWQCRMTPIGPILVLGYACPDDLREDGPMPECDFTGEWERYLLPDGTLLDDGYAYNDKRYATLRRRLGYYDRPDAATDEGRFESTLVNN